MLEEASVKRGIGVQYGPETPNKISDAGSRGLPRMIVSHAHKFIFLKTKKTAGTSIELALTELCGPEDVITPLTEIDEAKRAGGRCAQNWRLHGWWGSKRPLFKRRWFKFTAADYGFYNHMPAAEARRAHRRHGLAELFQIRLRPKPVGPAGLLLSSPLPEREGAAVLCKLHA